VGIWTEAAQFLFWEYINGIVVAMCFTKKYLLFTVDLTVILSLVQRELSCIELA